ncbi:hypothetical protein LEP1GSC087_4020 [Leptospira interrogans serovar Bataviae str. L1111]|nr:hypothetical protein LEP1GSC087_4020 [Leptospira interrogans serovar Bataviae str. L1111]
MLFLTQRFISMEVRRIAFYNKLKSGKDFVFERILNLLIGEGAVSARTGRPYFLT